jgi:hypothetical protein
MVVVVVDTERLSFESPLLDSLAVVEATAVADDDSRAARRVVTIVTRRTWGGVGRATGWSKNDDARVVRSRRPAMTTIAVDVDGIVVVFVE